MKVLFAILLALKSMSAFATANIQVYYTEATGNVNYHYNIYCKKGAICKPQLDKGLIGMNQFNVSATGYSEITFNPIEGGPALDVNFLEANAYIQSVEGVEGCKNTKALGIEYARGNFHIYCV